MALEDLTGTKYIDDLNASNPAAGDNVSEGDDHIRGIKNVLKVTLPNVTGAVTPTHTELNYVDGVTSAIQTQLNAISANDWVTAARIADNALDSDMYVDGSIDNAHLADDAVGVAELSATGTASNSVFLRGDNTWAAAGSTSASDLTSGTLPIARIANDAIDSIHYAAASIDNEHLADDAVGVAELSATGTASNSTFLRGDNTWTAIATDANTTTKGLYEHAHTIAANYSITSGNNAMAAGPITINSSVSVTVPSGSTWVIA